MDVKTAHKRLIVWFCATEDGLANALANALKSTKYDAWKGIGIEEDTLKAKGRTLEEHGWHLDLNEQAGLCCTPPCRLSPEKLREIVRTVTKIITRPESATAVQKKPRRPKKTPRPTKRRRP